MGLLIFVIALMIMSFWIGFWFRGLL